MLIASNGSSATKKLTGETVAELKSCHHITYGQECGWTIAYGKDKDCRLIVAVHANSREEIEQRLNPQQGYKNMLGLKGKRNPYH